MLTEPQQLSLNIPDFAKPGSTHRLVYYQWGDERAARTALCVHGLTRNGRDFDFLARALATDCRVLCPDMPGRGKSPPLADAALYTYPSYATDLGYFIQALHLTRLDWVGTSMGGILGMMTANAAPGLICKLVINDIGTIVSTAGIKRIADYADSNITFNSRAEAEAAMRQRWGTFGIKEEAHWQHLFVHGLVERDGHFSFAYDPAILAAYSKDREKNAAIADLNLWPLWEMVKKIPVLLIRGMESDLLTHETALQMQANHPALTLREIPGAGHAPALMDDAQVAMIKEWLDK